MQASFQTFPERGLGRVTFMLSLYTQTPIQLYTNPITHIHACTHTHTHTHTHTNAHTRAHTEAHTHYVQVHTNTHPPLCITQWGHDRILLLLLLLLLHW